MYFDRLCSFNNAKFSYLVSSNKNMACLEDYPFDINNLQNIIYFDEGKVKRNIYINSSNEKTLIKFFGYQDPNVIDYYLNFNLIINSGLNNYFNNYSPDSYYSRSIFTNYRYVFWHNYFFGLNEKYYLFIKKLYGISNAYKSSLELDELTDITKFYYPLVNYDNSNYNKLIKNSDLFIISGCQLFSIVVHFDSLYEFYLQKFDDLENIEMNSNILYFNNLVKLLNETKTYNINFNVDHLIKLDKNFEDAVVTFTDNNGKQYILNKEKRIINDLSGENIKVTSTKNALLYFYKKIPNYQEKGVIVFDKTQKGKNMKFNITNINDNKLKIYIVKDFGFPGYYPM